MKSISRAVAAVALSALCSLPLAAQPYLKASEPAMTSQTVDGTVITVEWSRPAARGREIFGALVPWGQVWTPGANWATTLELSRAAKVAGENVQAGKYSVWAIPGETEWTLLLHQDPKRFHLRKPKPDECRYKLTVRPRSAHHQESLAFYFTDITPTGATLNLHWGETVAPIAIEVERSFDIPKISRQQAAPYLGRYDFKIYGVAPDPIEMKLTIVEVEGELRGYLGAKESLQFIPTKAKGEFLFADLRAGEITNVQDFPVIFRFGADGRAVGYEYRNDPGGVRVAGERLD